MRVVELGVRCILAGYGVPFRPNMHIRCIAYVISLVVQALLFGIDKGDDPEKEDRHTNSL
jgi:hypothetical protein